MQLLTALDLHHNNAFFLIPRMESWTTDDRYYLGEPEKIFTARLQIPLSPGSNLHKYVVCGPGIFGSNLVSLCLKSAAVKLHPKKIHNSRPQKYYL